MADSAKLSTREWMDVPVVQYDVEYLPNPMPTGISDEDALIEFINARNRLIEALNSLAVVGPSGQAIVVHLEDGSAMAEFEPSPENYSIFVLEDLLSMDRYVYLEILDATLVGLELARKLIEALNALPGWAVGFSNIRNGYVILFADRVYVQGSPFATARTLFDVVTVMASNLHVFRGE